MDYNIGALSLRVKYTPTYPDELPEYSIDVTDGRLTDAQKERVMDALKTGVKYLDYDTERFYLLFSSLICLTNIYLCICI